MNGKLKCLYEFDSYTLNPDERSLLKDNQPVQLSPRAFDVLVVLVQNSGSLVEKQDLIEQVWNGQFVEEANIQVQISALRKALNDKDNGRYIETIPKKGYRFNHEAKIIRLGEPEKISGTNGFQPPAGEMPKKKAVGSGILKTIFRPAVILILLLSAIFLTIGFIYFQRTPANSSEYFQKMDIARLTTGGKVNHAAISPDGTNLAYQLSENGFSSLRLRNLPSGAEKEIIPPSESGFDSLIFSPDGNQVYYTQTDKDKITSLYHIPILNGESQKLVEHVYGRITFSPGGKRFAFVRIDEQKSEFSLISAKTDGSDEKILALSKIGELFHYPAWSPDGRTIAIFKRTADWDELGNRFKLIEIDAENGTERDMSEKLWQSVSFIAWLRDGSGFLMTAADRSAAPSQVWLVERESSAARRVTNDTNNYSEITVDDKSQKIAVVQTYGRSTIWLSGVGENFKEFLPVTIGPDAEEGNFGLSLSPGGKIAFSAKTNGNWDIWTMNADGSDRRKLTSGDFMDINPLFTPNGGQIVYLSQVGKGQTHIWKMNADGSGKQQLTGGFFEDYPVVSPDGKWIVFYGFDSFQKSSLRKVSIDGGEIVEIANNLPNSAMLPVRSRLMVSPDGKQIAFAALDESKGNRRHKIFIIPFEGGEPVKVLDTPPDFLPNTYVKWTTDGKAITYKSCSSLSCNLWNLPLDGSPAVQLTDFKSDKIYDFDWSRDGRRLAVARGSEMNDVVLISAFK